VGLRRGAAISTARGGIYLVDDLPGLQELEGRHRRDLEAARKLCLRVDIDLDELDVWVLTSASPSQFSRLTFCASCARMGAMAWQGPHHTWG
jgi:hypothetical protein